MRSTTIYPMGQSLKTFVCYVVREIMGEILFVAGCYLLDKNYHVTAIQLDELDKCSPLGKKNGLRFLKKGGKIVSDFDPLAHAGIILDGIFGTGFKGKVRQPYDSLIEAANRSGRPVIAIDIPSGLNGTTGEVEGNAIQAVATIFLGLPKTGFFLNQGCECNREAN